MARGRKPGVEMVGGRYVVALVISAIGCAAACSNGSASSGAGKPVGAACNRAEDDCAPSNEGQVVCHVPLKDSAFPDGKCQLQVRGTEGSSCAGTALGSINSDADRITICSNADGLQCVYGTCVKL
jgi:hypothetical protein